MSSKIAPKSPGRRSWSLAARLTAWYALTAFALVVAATSYLYWAMGRDVDRDDDDLLATRVKVVRALLRVRADADDEVWQHLDNEPAVGLTMFAYLRVMEEDGRVLAETPGMGPLLPPSLFPPPSDRAGQGVYIRAHSGRQFRVQAVRVAGAPGTHTRIIQGAIDRRVSGRLQDEYRQNLWYVLATALLACAAAGYQIARRGLRQVREITETAGRIRPSNLGERLATEGLPSELRALAGTFNRMLDRLEQSFQRLSQFSADIAHELRTPVNNLRGGMEVALGRPRDPEEYREVLESGLEECARLGRMIDGLLFLARAEHPQAQVPREPVEVGAELLALSEFYEAAAQDAGVELTVRAGGPAHAALNRGLFQRAVGNLVSNALTHTPAGGAVTVTAATDADHVRIEVADTGRGIAAEHLPHLFDRFYRADKSRTSADGGVGLGLAIVRSIVELHGGTAEIASEPGRGTRVTLRFPSCPAPSPADPEPALT